MNEKELKGLKAHIIEQSKGEPVMIDEFEMALFEAKVRQYLGKEGN